MKIALVIPDGTGIRNYLYSRLFAELRSHYEVVLLAASIEGDVIQAMTQGKQNAVNAYVLPQFINSITSKFCWEVSTFARLRNNVSLMHNPTLRSNWRPQKSSLSKRGFFSAVEILGWLCSKDKRFLASNERTFERSIRKSSAYHESLHLLTKIAPELLVCTHQRALNALPIFLAAQDLGIRTISAIYSWDNLPKARLAVKADEYLVWSDYMKEELETYYPEERHKPIHVTGTPQFEFYFDEKNYCSRMEFCEEHGLDPDRKIVCYSGGDTLTSPYDQQYVADLADAIMAMPESERPQLLLRRCPVDFSGRYDQVLRDHQSIIRVSIPKWKQGDGGSWALTYPLYDDVKLLVNTVRHCDVVYNMGSTMALDFFTFDKPAIYANYDPPNAKGWSTKTIYQFQHFRSMPSKDCVLWVNAKKDIGYILKRALYNPLENLPLRREWLRKIVGPSMEAASSNIFKVLAG